MKELKNFVDVTACTHWHISSVSQYLSILTNCSAFGKCSQWNRCLPKRSLCTLLYCGSRSFEFLLTYVQYSSSFYVEGNFALFVFHFALKLCFTFLALAFFLYLLINNGITMVSLCMRHFRHYSNESTDLPDIYCTRSKNVRDFTFMLRWPEIS